VQQDVNGSRRAKEYYVSDRHPDLLSVERTALFVVDIQEGFRRHIDGFDAMVAATKLLIEGCRELGVPTGYSEQYPAGLGHTVPELLEVLDGAESFEKVEISSVAAAGWRDLPPAITSRGAIVIAGIETHVCVNQTVHDLLHRGTRVHIAADAVGSRDPWQRDVALQRLERAGAIVTTVETVLFELLECAGTPQFKAVQALIKQHDAARRAAMEAVA
jgi:nicotinamidase-related amidase